jgi:anionic cell wall polymer biosynthesis LytR-Cps2A-Psr (LCP) family protein
VPDAGHGTPQPDVAETAEAPVETQAVPPMQPSAPIEPGGLADPEAAITGGAAAAAVVAAAAAGAAPSAAAGAGEPPEPGMRPSDVPAVPPSVTGPAPDLPPGFGQQVPDSRAARRRAQEEASRAQSHRTHFRLAVLGIAVVVGIALLALAWNWWSGRPGDPQPTPSASATGTAITQPTLLLQVTAEEDIAVANSLLSVGGPLGRANMIGVPQNTLMDVATGGTLPFGQIARLPDPDGSADALSDAIGVNVDGTLKMDTAALSGLVDAVGGITADVDVDVLETAPDGTQTILVPAGPGQVLQGPAAAAFATYLGEGETEEARIARFTQVFRLAVGSLPADITQVETILAQLGASAESTVPFDQLAAFFVRLQADIAADDVVYRNLPVKPIDAGGPAAYRVDNDAAAEMVSELLPEAVRTPGPNSKVRVLVQNGVGSPGLNAAARQLLVDASFTYVNGGNAPQFGQAATVIIVPDTTSESIAWGQQIAAALEVPESAVQVAIDGQSVADVIVVLGGDFVPEAS